MLGAGGMPKKQSQLTLARRDQVIVRFTRPFEKGLVKGYVIDIGPEFFLVALVSDAIRFNGFQCFRLADVRKLQVPCKYAAFAEAALKKLRSKSGASGFRKSVAQLSAASQNYYCPPLEPFH